MDSHSAFVVETIREAQTRRKIIQIVRDSRLTYEARVPICKNARGKIRVEDRLLKRVKRDVFAVSGVAPEERLVPQAQVQAEPRRYFPGVLNEEVDDIAPPRNILRFSKIGPPRPADQELGYLVPKNFP